MTTSYIHIEDRALLCLKGPDSKNLLQGIITNDINRLKPGVALYAALLTPQGKYLFDFFIYETDDVLYIDCEKTRRNDLLRRLMMYRLRAEVEITLAEGHILNSPDLPSQTPFFKDPRHEDMGYRIIAENIPEDAAPLRDYHLQRIKLGIPEGSVDFQVDKTPVLEGSFEALHGVDFKKGCYVGQEVTARMQYRGTVKKYLLPLKIDGPLPAPYTIITDDQDVKIGHICSGIDQYAIGLLRLDRMEFEKSYSCGDAAVTPYKVDWNDV